MDNQNNCAEKMTDKQVMFSCECIYIDECKVCEKTFERKVPLQTTSFYQLDKDITVLVSETESKIIVDTGSPKSIVGSKDFQTFRKSLSHFQQENLKILPVKQSFKFGPSGPYECREKVNVPIKNGSVMMWAEFAVVDANVPMLLGNLLVRKSKCFQQKIAL